MPDTRTEILTSIPREKLPDIIRGFEDDGAIKVRTESQSDGTFTVEAVFQVFEKDVRPTPKRR